MPLAFIFKISILVGAILYITGTSIFSEQPFLWVSDVLNENEGWKFAWILIALQIIDWGVVSHFVLDKAKAITFAFLLLYFVASFYFIPPLYVLVFITFAISRTGANLYTFFKNQNHKGEDNASDLCQQL